MKKILFVFTLTILCLGTASAQEGFGFGAKVGANVSNLRYSTEGLALRLESQVGPTAGIFADYVFRNGFGVAVEAIYAKQGLKWDATEVVDAVYTREYDMRIHMHHLEFPVLASYYFADGFAVRLGIQPGVLLRDRTNYTIVTFRNGEEWERQELDLKDIYERFDLSIPFGFSYLFPFGLMFDTRYHFGLRNINRYFDDTRIRNDYFSVTVGYRF